MFADKTFLAVIPARGGSKRLPGKNILPLAGKPLIAWSIEAAKKSKYIDQIVVSSDSDEILDIARMYQVESVKRSAALASDMATTYAVVEDILSIYSQYDYVVLLQPTSPLRQYKHIDEAIELLDEKKADAIVSVCEMEHSPLWTNTLPSDGDMSHFLQKEICSKRSQDLEQYYRLNGAIYICNTKKYLQEKSFFLEKNIYAYKMAREYSVDIDEAVDFKLAQFYCQENNF